MAQHQCPQCYNYEITTYKPKPFWIWLVPMAVIDIGLVLVLVSGRVENPVGLIVALIAVDMLLTLPLVRAILSRRNFPNGAIYHCESCGYQWTEVESMAEPEMHSVPRNSSDFQMTVEDVFFIKGRGTVVTGCVESGMVHVGDTIALLGASGITQTVVEGIEQFRRVKQRAEAGDNVGIFLRGGGKDAVQRGDVLKRSW